MPETTPTPTTLTDRAVLRLSGDDVRGFLQGLVTQDVAGDLPVWAGLLTPQGKCLFDFLVWSDGDDLLIDCDAVAAEALKKRLTPRTTTWSGMRIAECSTAKVSMTVRSRRRCSPGMATT